MAKPAKLDVREAISSGFTRFEDLVYVGLGVLLAARRAWRRIRARQDRWRVRMTTFAAGTMTWFYPRAFVFVSLLYVP
jgi:hypothetical protein